MHYKSFLQMAIFYVATGSSICYCQTSPTPNVAALLKVQGTDINESDGAANISIPLHDIQVDNVNVPLTLSYDSKGVKVEEIAGNAGTSWTLTGTSLISRQIYGLPDEFDKKLTYGNGIVYTGGSNLSCISLLTYSGYKWVDNAPNSVSAAAYFLSHGNMEGYTGNAYKNEFGDKQPDLFTYILPNGRRGTFIIQRFGNIISSSNDLIRVSFQNQETSSGQMVSFTVQDESGNTYFFDIIEKRVNKTWNYLFGQIVWNDFMYLKESALDPSSSPTNTGYCTNSSQNNSSDGWDIFNTPTYVAWHLSKVVTYNQKTINYTYEDEYHTRLSNTLNTYSQSGYGTLDGFVRHFKNSNNEELFSTKRLVRIDHPSGYVKVNYKIQTREDVIASALIDNGETVDGTSPMRMSAVESIQVFDKNNLQVKNIGFFTSYRNAVPIGNSNPSYLYKRLWLDKVAVNDAIYEFKYNEGVLPNKFSREQDFWGYYNANNSDTNGKSLVPDLWFYPGDYRSYTRPTNFSIFRRASYTGTELKVSASTVFHTNLVNKVSNRDINATAMQYGMLEKIIYPTKGYEKFIYEPNDFLYENELRQGFGLRVTSIEQHDSDDTLLLTTNYSYKNANGTSSGTVTNIPVFGKLLAIQNATTPYRYTLRSTSFSDDQYCHYSRVEKSNPGNGKIVSEYMIPYSIETTTNFVTVYSPILYLKNTDYAKLRIDCTSCGLPAFQEPINTWEYSPMPMARNLENLFGRKNKEFIYDATNNLMSKKEIIFFVSNTSKRIDIFQGQTANYDTYKDYDQYNVSYTFGELHKGFEEVTTYLSGAPIITENEYTFDNNLLVKFETTDSKGQAISREIKYPKSFMYTYNTTNSGVTSVNNNVYLVMNALNFLNYPIEEITKINGNVSSGKISKYRYYKNTDYMYGLLLKKEELVLDVNKPVSDYVYATPITNYTLPDAGPLNTDSRYRKVTEYKNYDYSGNIVEIKKEDGLNTIYIWGYNKTLPLAKIEGVEYSSLSTSVISNLQTLSNQDNDHCQLTTCKEQLLRNALNNLRTSLSGAMVTTYTYDPLVGITSITDPRGNTNYYEYDPTGRLIAVKDTDKNVLSQNEYHYKP